MVIFDEVMPIIDHVKTANLKGEIELGENCFWWNIGEIRLFFELDTQETTVEYFYNSLLFGHFHVENDEVIKLIQEINREDKIIEITVYLSGTGFAIIDKADKKRSGFFKKRYYSE